LIGGPPGRSSCRWVRPPFLLPWLEVDRDLQRGRTQLDRVGWPYHYSRDGAGNRTAAPWPTISWCAERTRQLHRVQFVSFHSHRRLHKSDEQREPQFQLGVSNFGLSAARTTRITGFGRNLRRERDKVSCRTARRVLS
jgi:hypothetical protein